MARERCSQQVMLVEDDSGLRRALREILEEEGYVVAAAANGAEALDLLRRSEQDPCLILLDVMMPVMDGWTFREEQLRDPELNEIPVVVLSADGHAQSKAEKMKAVCGLTKPVELEHLLAVVEQFCAAG